jgi:hypothetical protein
MWSMCPSGCPQEATLAQKSPESQKKPAAGSVGRYEKPLAARGEGTLDPVNRGAATDRQGCDPWTSLFLKMCAYNIQNKYVGGKPI